LLLLLPLLLRGYGRRATSKRSSLTLTCLDTTEASEPTSAGAHRQERTRHHVRPSGRGRGGSSGENPAHMAEFAQ